jgi:hypothetical protein
MKTRPDINNECDIIYTSNRALLGEIRANMRMICVNYSSQNKTFTLYTFLNSPFNQKELDYDVTGTILSEIISDFSNDDDVIWKEKTIVSPYPNDLPDQGISVYYRFENVPKNNNKKISFSKISDTTNINNGNLAIFLNQALLGEIRPNTREVSLVYDTVQKLATIYIYFDNPRITKEMDYNIETVIGNKLKTLLPIEIKVIVKTIFIPFPQQLPRQGICIFSRYENEDMRK